MPPSSVKSVSQYLFNHANTEATAKTVQEIADETKLSTTTVHRIVTNIRKRPAGIQQANASRKTNTRSALQYWYSMAAVNEATKAYENQKLLGDIVIPNNSTAITPRDVLKLYLPKDEAFEAIVNDDKNLLNLNTADEVLEWVQRQLIALQEMHFPEDRYRRNLLITGLAMAQKALDMGWEDE